MTSREGRQKDDVCVHNASLQCEGLQVREVLRGDLCYIWGGLQVNAEAATTIFGFEEINADPSQTPSATKV